MLLEGRVAIVTGGAKGFGSGIVTRFADEGASVAIVDIDAEAADAMLSEVQNRGREGMVIPCDVTDESQVRSMVDTVIGKYGKVDILVSNAGGSISSFPIEDLPLEDWNRSLALNLTSSFLCCKAVVPNMKQRRSGSIVITSSAGAHYPPAHSVHYHSAKAGLLGLTHDTARALAPFNIRVNAILPGPGHTNFGAKAMSAFTKEEQDAFYEKMGKEHIPLQRIATPEDIAGAALYLGSDLSAFVTGQSIIVAGGIPLTPVHAVPTMKKS